MIVLLYSMEKGQQEARRVVLTGDRPSGNLHIGHYAGSLAERVRMQESGKYEIYILIADLQALTDNANNPEKVKNAVEEILLDYLAVGLRPDKVNFVLQSSIPALFELPMYYINLVTQARLERNPTVRSEIKSKGYNKDIPVGFVNYPISQAADITAFGAEIVPTGVDQAPMMEQTREIVATFNRLYGETLVMPRSEIQSLEKSRLVGIDGKGKMSKSAGNCIYLKDDEKTLKEKIFSMYTDPNHIKVTDPGKVEGNLVFTYLDAFYTDKKHLAELKSQYKKGGLGDVFLKNLLFNCLNEILTPMRERRKEYQKDMPAVREYLKAGTEKATKVTNEVLKKVRKAIGIYSL